MGKRKRVKIGIPTWIRHEGRLRRYTPTEDSQDKTALSSKHVQICSRHIKQCSILDLPDECLLILFSKLEYHEICNVSAVCKRFCEVSRNPTLWKSVELSFSALFKSKIVSIDVDSEHQQLMTNAKRRELFVSFLSARKAALNDIRACINISEEVGMLLRLLDNCNVTRLQSIDLKWLQSSNHYVPRQFKAFQRSQVKAFQSILRCLTQKKCAIKFLRCYLDVSRTTAQLLGGLGALEHLNINFIRQPLEFDSMLHPETMATILSSLPNLKYLKINIAQVIPDTFSGYVLESDSLEELVFGFTKQLHIKDLILPKLHTFEAEYLCRQGSTNQGDVCLFKVIEKGCPLIQKLNTYTSLTPGLKNFHLSESQKTLLFFCSCPDHMPCRVYY